MTAGLHVGQQVRDAHAALVTRARNTPAEARGPERIAPDWWQDDSNGRSGVRDHRVVTTQAGDRLWLYYGHGGARSSG